MDSLLIFGALVGSVMLVVGLALIVPEIAIDSPLDLLMSFSKGSSANFFSLVHTHICEGWPQTGVAASLYYGGLVLLALTLLGFWLRSMWS